MKVKAYNWLGPFIFLFFCIQLPAADEHIKIDQFGYRPNDKKIAIISHPLAGYNSNSPFTPGTTYQVKRASDHAVIFSDTIASWNKGATHAQSGDKVWWFDFSSVVSPGTYYIFDPANNASSHPFEISDCAYNQVLKHSFRTFYYQRCGVAKTAAHAGNGWADAPCHLSTQQDADCRLYNNTGMATSKDLSGGWHDAGDYNKYVNFTWVALTDLLLAYEENPAVWSDDNGIPESGNGIPDILDELKHELDWLLKMQNSDGSVLSVVGGGSASPPSADAAFRRYGPATTAASFTAASVFALAAIQFKSAGQTDYAATLQAAAVNAWNWADANPGITFYNSGKLAAGEQEPSGYGVLGRKLAASCFLFALTGTTAYRSFFNSNYTQMHLIQWGYAYPFEMTEQSVLLYYTKIPGATGAVVNDIKNEYTFSITTSSQNLPSYKTPADAYRASLPDNDYTWGSNSVKAHKANMYLLMNVHALDPGNASNYRDAALGFVNYLHGVNPTSLVYLSNMNQYRAENSINEFYHAWFTDGSSKWDRVGSSTYGPAPGFITGGPNPNYKLDACCPSSCGGSNALCVTLTPPLNQPIQKAYRDWNTSWPQNSWEVTENAIYYQAAYIRMLSKFCSAQPCDPTKDPETTNANNAWVKIYLSEDPGRIRIKTDLRFDRAMVLEVFDMQGRMLKRVALPPKENQELLLGDIPRGIYVVKCYGTRHFTAQRMFIP